MADYFAYGYNEENMEQQVSGVVGSKASRGGRGKWFVLAGIVALSLVATAAYVAMNKQKQATSEKLVASSVCKDDTSKQAAGFMNGNGDSPEYGKLTQKIKEMKDYDRDPNCLYVLLKYNLSKNLSNNNDTYMSRLEKVYDPNTGFSREFSNPSSLQALREQVAQMKSLNNLHDSENDKIDQAQSDTIQYAEELDVPRQ